MSNSSSSLVEGMGAEAEANAEAGVDVEQHGEWDRAAYRHRGEVERGGVVYRRSTPCCLYYLWLLAAFFLSLFICGDECVPDMDDRMRYGLLLASALSMGVLAVVWWRRRAEISGRLREGRARPEARRGLRSKVKG